MATDAWGIDDGYEDARGERRAVPEETISALRRAMRCPSEPPRVEREVLVVREDASPMLASGKLVLEDGAELKLPVKDNLADLPLGYHDFFPDDDTRQPVKLIVTPGKCPLPPKGLWGWSAQLYAARSQESWGFGDLADLRRLASWARSQGAGLMLVNPLSAAAPIVPQQPSPYFPSSRRFLNPLYLRIEDVPGAQMLGEQLAGLAALGRQLNGARTIDRDAVFKLKREALEVIWTPGEPPAEFDRFLAERGESLRQFAAYCALAEKYGADWRRWPAEYHDCRSDRVRQFADENRDRVQYHQWLQWLLDQQLAHAANDIKLMQDLAIGVDPGGADAWAWRDLYADGCTVGAPPDLYNVHGQDWGLPPWIPHKLRAAGYQPFIETLRATLRHAGGLRVDHVMGLFRLFWIPQGASAPQGAFVRYRWDEMLAIVALECHRAGAFAVGEDLGTVDEQCREQLAAHQVLSYRLLWFEDQFPSAWPQLAMAAVSTHDLPTVAGLWTGDDLAAQRSLGLDPNEKGIEAMRKKLAKSIKLKQNAGVEETIEATYRLLADAASLVATVSLDDALAVHERPNMPCTLHEWPNWSLALPGGIEALENSELAKRIAAAMRKRTGRNKPYQSGDV